MRDWWAEERLEVLGRAASGILSQEINSIIPRISNVGFDPAKVNFVVKAKCVQTVTGPRS